MDEYLSITEAAALIGRSHDSISRWIQTGRLRLIRYGPRGTLISRSELEAMPLPKLGRPMKGEAR